MPVVWYFERSEKKSGAVRHEGTARHSRWDPRSQAMSESALRGAADGIAERDRKAGKGGQAKRAASRCSCSCFGLHVALQTHSEDEWRCSAVERCCVRSLSFVWVREERPMHHARFAWRRRTSQFQSTTAGSLTDFLSSCSAIRTPSGSDMEVSGSVRQPCSACRSDVAMRFFFGFVPSTQYHNPLISAMERGRSRDTLRVSSRVSGKAGIWGDFAFVPQHERRTLGDVSVWSFRFIS